MFSSLFLRKKIVSSFLIAAILFLGFPNTTLAGGGGSGSIFSIIVSVVTVAADVLLCDGLCGGALGTLGLTTIAEGSSIGFASAAFAITTSAISLSGGGGTITSQTDAIQFLGTTIGLSTTGVCPEGYYNSQNKICVPVGSQSCLDVGVKGYCPASYSCSSGGSCSPGRATQPGVTLNFSVDKPEPSIHENVNFSWDSTGATSCVLNQGIGGLHAAGTLPLTFDKPGLYDFVLRCAGEGGEKKKIITIDIPTVVAQLNTGGTFAAINNPFRLTWTSQSAQACSIDNNIGAVSLSGSQQVSFNALGDKTITLSCTGRGGTATSFVKIKILTQQEYSANLTAITTAPDAVQVNTATVNSLTSPTSPVPNVTQSVLNSLTPAGQ